MLTFDFAHFRATAPVRGEWRLVLDDTNTALEGFTLGNSSTTEYHVTPMID